MSNKPEIPKLTSGLREINVVPKKPDHPNPILQPDILPDLPFLSQPGIPLIPQTGNLIGPKSFPNRRPIRPSHIPPGVKWDPITPFPPPQENNDQNPIKPNSIIPFGMGDPNPDHLHLFNNFNNPDLI